MELSIIIVNYKTPQLLLRCIDSIANTISKNLMYEIIVVDNCSNDNSREHVISNYPDINWIQKNENDGFGRANNIGIKQSTGEYILLLNSDMVVVENTIEACFNKIKSEQNIGALGCRLLNEDGTLQKSIYHNLLSLSNVLRQNICFDYIFKLKQHKIDALMGSFLLIPRKVFDEVGLFDPDFFMYSEEVDLCRRITNYGYSLFYYDDVYAYHKHGASSSDISWVNKQKLLSHALLIYKAKGFWRYGLYHCLMCLNAIMNFFAMWFVDKSYGAQYRKEYCSTQSYYFCNMKYYLLIPFIYSKKIGHGKRMLRIN